MASVGEKIALSHQFFEVDKLPILYAISTLTFSTEECLGENKGSGGQLWIEHTYAPWGSSA